MGVGEVEDVGTVLQDMNTGGTVLFKSTGCGITQAAFTPTGASLQQVNLRIQMKHVELFKKLLHASP